MHLTFALALLTYLASAVTAKPYAGGAGKAIYFYNTTTIASIGTGQTVTGFPTDEVTIEFWAKPYLYPNPQQIYTLFSLAVEHSYNVAQTDFGLDDNFITWTTDRTLWFMSKAIFPSGFDMSKAEPGIVTHFNQWQHWAFTFKSATGEVRLYRDDTLLADSTTTIDQTNHFASDSFKSAKLSSSSAIIFGQDQDTYYGTFSRSKAYVGLIDEVRIWNVARTADQIKQYRGISLDPASGDPAATGLWGAWRMDTLTGSTIPNDVALGAPMLLGGSNAFPNDPACTVGSDPEAPYCNRIPRWVPSDAPVIGSGSVFQLVAPGPKVSRVALPGYSDSIATLTYTVTDDLSSSCSGWSFYKDDPPTIPFSTGVIDGEVFAKPPTPGSGSCSFSYTVGDGTPSSPASATIQLAISDGPIARNVLVDATQGGSGLYVPLSSKNPDQPAPAQAIIKQLPTKGVLYAVTQQQLKTFTRVKKLQSGDSIEPGSTVVEYVPLPNEYGVPFDNMTFNVVNQAAVSSAAEGKLTVNVGMRSGVAAVAAINPYYLTFVFDNVLTVPTFDLVAMPEFAVEMWLWPNPTGATPKTIWNSQGGVYKLWLTADSALTFSIEGSVLLSGPTIGAELWSHIAVSRSVAGKYALYVNNTVVATATASQPASGGIGLTIGGGFEGGIDEVAIWKNSSVMGDGRRLDQLILPQQTDLVAVWHFAEGKGGTTGCLSASDCPHIAHLGNGVVNASPFWTSAPLSASVNGYVGYPTVSTFIGTENVDQMVIQLNALTLDADTRLLAVTINSLPKLGQLYQYDENNPPTYRGAPITHEFQLWRSSVPRDIQWVARVAETQWNQGPQFDPQLKLSTQYGAGWDMDDPTIPQQYSVAKIIGPPNTYDIGKKDLGYGDSTEAWCTARSGYTTNGAVRDCAAGPGFVSDSSQNPFDWYCPAGTEREYLDVGFNNSTHIMGFSVFENYNPGSIEVIQARHPDSGEWITIWQGKAQVDLYDSSGSYIAQTYRIFSPQVCGTPFKTNATKIEMATWKVPGYKEIDAALMIGANEMEAGYVLDPKQRVVYVPNRDADGLDEFSFGATDCIGDLSQLSSASPVQVFLKSLIHKPASGAKNDNQSAFQYEIKRDNGGMSKKLGNLQIALQSYNRDGRPSQFIVTEMPKYGKLLDLNNNVVPANTALDPSSTVSAHYSYLNLTFAATKGCGTDAFSYVIDDGVMRSDAIPVTVTVWCLPYTDYNDPMSIIVILLTAIGLLGVALSAVLTVVRAQHSVFRAASPTFLGLILLGIGLVFIANLLYPGPPSKAKCMGAPTLLAVGFSIAMGGLCVKNWRVYFIFNNRRVAKNMLDNKRLLQFTGALIIPNIIILAVWGARDPAVPVLLQPNTPEQYYVCSASSQSSAIALIAYNGVILVVTAIFAFLNRNIALKYNESKQLAIAAYNVLIFCLFGFPLVYMNGTAQNVIFIIRGLAIWAASFIALVVIFVPKAWLTMRPPKGKTFDLRSPTSPPTLRLNDAKTSAGAISSSENTTPSGQFTVQTMNTIQQKVVVRTKRGLMYGPWKEVYGVLLPNTKTLIFHSETTALIFNLTTDSPKIEVLPVDKDSSARTLRLEFTTGNSSSVVEIQLKSENDAMNWASMLQKTKEMPNSSKNSAARKTSGPPTQMATDTSSVAIPTIPRSTKPTQFDTSYRSALESVPEKRDA